MSRGEQKTKSLFAGTKAASVHTAVFDIRGGITGAAIQVVIVEDCISAKAFATTDVIVATNIITEVGHGYETGLKGQFTTTTTLPAGISAVTDYFIIDVGSDTYSIATTRANAIAGTAVNITTQGTGTHTFTPVAADSTSGTVTVKYSVDGNTYAVDAGAGLLNTPGTILAAGLTVIDNADGLHYNYVQVVVDVTDSQWVLDIDMSGKV